MSAPACQPEYTGELEVGTWKIPLPTNYSAFGLSSTRRILSFELWMQDIFADTKVPHDAGWRIWGLGRDTGLLLWWQGRYSWGRTEEITSNWQGSHFLECPAWSTLAPTGYIFYVPIMLFSNNIFRLPWLFNSGGPFLVSDRQNHWDDFQLTLKLRSCKKIHWLQNPSVIILYIQLPPNTIHFPQQSKTASQSYWVRLCYLFAKQPDVNLDSQIYLILAGKNSVPTSFCRYLHGIYCFLTLMFLTVYTLECIYEFKKVWIMAHDLQPQFL